MKVFIATLLLVGTVLAAGDNKDSAKTKRGYSLGYGYNPYPTYYDHETIDHAPIATSLHPAPIAAIAHAPVAAVHAPIISHAPYIASHAPVVAHAPIISHAPIVAAPLAKVTSSVVSTNIQHYPSTYVAPVGKYIAAPAASYIASPAASYIASPAASYISSPYTPASYYHAPAAASYYHAPASASYYHAPAAFAPTYAHAPLLSEFHRR